MQKKKVGVGFGVMVLREGKVLLGQRHIDPDKADSELHGEGTWTMPGGKLEFGEGFEEGAARELKEETGMILKNVEVACVQNDRVADAHFVTIGMLATDVEGEPQVLEPDEITRWAWFELDNLPKPLFFPSERVVESYLAGKFYIRRD